VLDLLPLPPAGNPSLSLSLAPRVLNLTHTHTPQL
jgi:hypothetical protein